MVWQLLIDNEAFNGIQNEYLPKVKELYEGTFVELSKLQNINLTQRNKMVIAEIIKRLVYFKTSNISKPLEEVKIQLNSCR